MNDMVRKGGVVAALTGWYPRGFTWRYKLLLSKVVVALPPHRGHVYMRT